MLPHPFTQKDRTMRRRLAPQSTREARLQAQAALAELEEATGSPVAEFYRERLLNRMAQESRRNREIYQQRLRGA